MATNQNAGSGCAGIIALIVTACVIILVALKVMQGCDAHFAEQRQREEEAKKISEDMKRANENFQEQVKKLPLSPDSAR